MGSEQDRDSLQQDLNWSDKWKLKFNPMKSKVLHLGRNNKKYEYVMNKIEM